MNEPEFTRITSRDNALVKELRRLAHDTVAYRVAGRVWLEGEHLCSAAIQRRVPAAVAVFSESNWVSAPMEYRHNAIKNIVIADSMFQGISALESPAGMGFVMELGEPKPVLPTGRTIVLDRLQDAGNVGSILRSAAAFGFEQVLAIKGTAGLWSPKVLRAGMGAHFALRLIEGMVLDDLLALTVPLLATSSHNGMALQACKLPAPAAWVLGHEGQGVQAELLARAHLLVRIEQPGGEESLNVAAAAAICLHASAVGALASL